EFQLKGSGRTPFSRSGDGRAALRSSVREFLAKEGMHFLGVPTARALSLVVDTELKIQRQWYPEAQNKDEQAAILTRVSPSFLRVGQVELFAKENTATTGSWPADVSGQKQKAKESQRTLPHEQEALDDAQASSLLTVKNLKIFLLIFAHRLAFLHAEWLRVGYVQGNMNSDNCLLNGYSLDYGPFGFLEQFDPLWCPWIGGGEKFSYSQQPK
ncbi:unnamed protein product, partial [Amoebophrya sp. A120]